ncbi:MAG: nucleotide exchange factor GrpE [Rikenellaceae bacterium]|nr:nucleotide exchange factor GrpE [Rikenellaceae bacterium]
MSKNKNEKEQTVFQDIEDDKTYQQGDGYPNCEGTPCDNMAEGADTEADNLADAEPAAEDALTIALAEAAGWKDKYIRLQAEFDNYRKRTLKEKMELVATGGEDVIKSLLGVMDDLERALNAVRTATDVDALRTGVEMIDGKFREVLRSKGVEEIEAMGKEFDVDHHEAIAKIPAPTPETKGKIVDVVQKGYKLKDKVVRYAKVVVGE